MRNILRLILTGLFLCLSAFANATPRIQTWETDNGAHVLFVPTKGIPMLDVRITFDAGAARDDGLAGLAVLTNGLLAEGAAGMSSQQIAEAFESVGAQFDNDALRDMALLSLRTLVDKRYLNGAMETFRKVLTLPDFLQKAFERELNRMKVSVRASEQSPADIASKAFYKAIYGDHPYSSPVSGTLESLDRITLDDIKAFYSKYYVARNATISIVGEVERKQAEEIVNAFVSALPTGEKAPDLPEVKALTEAKTVFIKYPSVQTHIYVGQPGIKRGDRDYFALYLANHPFGGSGFASRLVDVIREKNGLAYSVYSYFSPMRKAGPFMMGMQTRTDQAGQALSLLKEELHNYLKNGPTSDEIEASKSNITGSFPLNLDSNSKLLDYIAMMGFYNLDIEYLDHFIENVNAVTIDQINDAMKRRIDADKMVTVIVGKSAP